MATQHGPVTLKEVRLPQGTIRYREEGTGPALVFVHGLLANSVLWRDVIARLSDRFRCVAPELPLGGHAVPLDPSADLSPAGLARLLVGFMEALELADVTLVGNDTGGAICQIVITAHPDRVGGLVLTNCDAYHAFLPLPLRPFQWGARLFGDRFTGALGRALHSRRAQRLLLSLVAKRRMDEATLDAYVGSFIGNAGVRRDAARFLAAISSRYTVEAAKHFATFLHPVLIVWGTDDRFFVAGLARRLQRDFADARLDFVAGSRAFVPEDWPDALANEIAVYMDGRKPA